MYVMCHDIKVGSSTLQRIESVTIESDIDSLSDTCSITLPSSVFGEAANAQTAIKRGDAVVVKLGYNDDLVTEFEGFVRAISDTHPIQIECEDAAFLFRKSIRDKQFKKTTVPEVLRYTIGEVNRQLGADQQLTLVTDLTGLQFDSFTIVQANGYEVLKSIREQYGVAIYCRGRAVHCHLLYTEKRGQVTYDFYKNIERKSDLIYVKAEDRKVKITVKGRGKKGGVVEVSEGEDGGDTLTVNRPTISDKATLRAIARQLKKKQSYDGYKGAIRGWLIPFCDIGYTAYLVNKDHPERQGGYFVKGKRVEFSKEGGVRLLELGIKVLTSAGAAIPEATAVN